MSCYTVLGISVLLQSFRDQCLVTKFKGPVSGYTVLGVSVLLQSLRGQCLVTQF